VPEPVQDAETRADRDMDACRGATDREVRDAVETVEAGGCPYCDSSIGSVPDAHDNGGYRECLNGHTHHVDDWQHLHAEAE
jgi:hypothetical protein